MIVSLKEKLEDVFEEHAEVCLQNKVLKDALKAIVRGGEELDETSFKVVLDGKGKKALDKAVRECL